MTYKPKLLSSNPGIADSEVSHCSLSLLNEWVPFLLLKISMSSLGRKGFCAVSSYPRCFNIAMRFSENLFSVKVCETYEW